MAKGGGEVERARFGRGQNQAAVELQLLPCRDVAVAHIHQRDVEVLPAGGRIHRTPVARDRRAAQHESRQDPSGEPRRLTVAHFLRK